MHWRKEGAAWGYYVDECRTVASGSISGRGSVSAGRRSCWFGWRRGRVPRTRTWH